MSRSLVLLVLLLLVLGLSAGQVVTAAPDELFFSEYIEGSSFNKAVEIYNGTGATVDLAAGVYDIHISSNGGTSTTTIALTGTVADGDVYVVAHADAAAAIEAQEDQSTSSLSFNGDDAVVLRKDGTVIDSIGQVGFRPTIEWGTGLVSTADNTLRRKVTVCAGDPIADDVFDPAVEWDGYATDTFDGLGSHTVTCDETQEPRLNEFSANTTDPDFEFVEVFGAADTDYSNLTILEIEGDSSGAGVIDEVIAVGTTDSNGFWLAELASGALENGTITLLLVSNFSGALAADLDADNDGILDDPVPWDSIVDSVAVTDGGTDDRTYGDPVLARDYDGVSFTPGGASRIPDGYDTEAATDWVRNDFDLAGIPGFTGTPVEGEAYNTPGAPNEVYVAPPEACGDPYTPIYDIQGSGLASPIDGDPAATEGVVVGDFQADDGDEFSTDLRGFFIQDPTGDGNRATSDGIFVYAPGAMDVAEGDHVRVSGVVSEFNEMTQISSSNLLLCATGVTIAPTPITLPVADMDEYERHEGMLVTFPQALTISEYYNFDRYGEIMLTGGRQFQPTAVYEPGSWQAAALAAQNALYRITLDDGRSSQNPDPARHPNGDVFDMDNLFRGGDVVTNLTGALNYSFGLYRVQPTTGADYTPANPRPAAPEEVGGNITVASFNVLNYFLTLDLGPDICGPLQDMECRGADSSEEFDRQRAKILSALAAIDADVFGLIEMENTPDVEPLADIVAGLNDVMGAGTYAYVDTGVIGTDAIRAGLIYKTATVSPVGDYAILDSSVDARFLDGYNRPVLAQAFMDGNTGGIVTVAVNHLKSKGSTCDAIGDPDLGDGAGNCNLTRLAAAQALVDWLDTDPTGSGSANNLIIGDLNSYDKEDPIDAILMGADDDASETADNYVDLLYDYIGEFAYSYLFDGQLGYLDYALANMDLLPWVTGATVWHINADEPDLIDYDTSFKQAPQDALFSPDPYRSSDHDPVIVGLTICDVDADGPAVEVSVLPDDLWPPTGELVTVETSIDVSDNFDDNPTVTFVSVTSSDPGGEEDIVVVDDDTFQLRSEWLGNPDGRTYTITYEATDVCGNTTTASATVTVAPPVILYFPIIAKN